MSLIKTAITSIMAHKMRTFLTVLGIVIGIASIIIVFSAGAGMEGLFRDQLESFGSNTVITEIKVPSNKKNKVSQGADSGTNIAQGVQITTLTLDDQKDILKLANIENSYAGIMGQEKVSYKNESRKILIFGTNASYIDIDKSEIKFGRFFTKNENNSLSKVVILGKKIKEKLFGDTDAIGKQIQIRNLKFRVIGVLAERGAYMGVMDFDNQVYVPIKTLQKRMMNISHVMYMTHVLKDSNRDQETAEEVREVLRENHNIRKTNPIDTGLDDFSVTTMVEAQEMINTIMDAITLLLICIVTISLIVGGIGIMNIMYVAVSERSQEIGLRKAVGANYADIMRQFLVESVLITLLGAAVGIVVGFLIALLISIGANYSGLVWEFSIPVKAYWVAICFSAVCGILFGLYPAREAGKLDPITALRK